MVQSIAVVLLNLDQLGRNLSQDLVLAGYLAENRCVLPFFLRVILFPQHASGLYLRISRSGSSLSTYLRPEFCMKI